MLIRKQTLRVSEVMKAVWLEKICLCPSDRVAIYTAKGYSPLPCFLRLKTRLRTCATRCAFNSAISLSLPKATSLSG